VVPVNLPLNNTGSIAQHSCIDILKDFVSEQMFCLEFDLQGLSLQNEQENGDSSDQDENIRIVN